MKKSILERGLLNANSAGKCFSQAGSLRRHKRVHNGEKPYECKRCGKCFKQAGDLRRHKRVHAGEKPYECKRCGKFFNHLRSLRKHKRAHKDAANCVKDTQATQTWSSQNAQSEHVEKHICWICQEELCSEALLVEHYENHMASV